MTLDSNKAEPGSGPQNVQQWQPVDLPFFRKDQKGPSLIPSVEIIRKSSDSLTDRNASSVVAVSPEIIVKFGRGVREREGQTLLFLESKLPDIAVPRLYAMFREGKELFIVMERIHGERLDRIWPDLTQQDKSTICEELKFTFDTIRGIPYPTPSFFGSVDGGPVPHHLFFTFEQDPLRSGPFSTENEFNQGLVEQYKAMLRLNGFENTKAAFYERSLARVLQGHRVSFTHGDVQRKNIILKGFDRAASNKSQQRLIPVLVDWEDAGWYPEYWEYFAASTAFNWSDDWSDRIEEFLMSWPAEMAITKMINTDLFF